MCTQLNNIIPSVFLYHRDTLSGIERPFRSIDNRDAPAPRNTNRGNIIETLCRENRIGGGRFLIRCCRARARKDQSLAFVFVSSTQRWREIPPICLSASPSRPPSAKVPVFELEWSGRVCSSHLRRTCAKPESRIGRSERNARRRPVGAIYFDT